MVLMTAAQFRRRHHQLTLRTVMKHVVVLAQALMPLPAQIGISASGVERIVADIDLAAFHLSIAKGSAPVIYIVDSHSTPGDDFGFPSGRGRQGQQPKLFFISDQPMSSRAGLTEPCYKRFAWTLAERGMVRRVIDLVGELTESIQ